MSCMARLLCWLCGREASEDNPVHYLPRIRDYECEACTALMVRAYDDTDQERHHG